MELLCKILGGILVMGGSGYFALSINRGLEQRVVELRRLYSLLLQLKSEIQYMGNTLPESFRSLSEGAAPPFFAWLFSLAERLENDSTSTFCIVWQESLDELCELSYLEESDIALLRELSDKLGTADVTAQLKAIDYVLLHIEQKRKDLEGEIKEKKKVVASLSLFAGVLILIMLL